MDEERQDSLPTQKREETKDKKTNTEFEVDNVNERFHGGVYVLANRDNTRTYVGCAGTSFYHRLRQHNREISGGARATSSSRTWYHRFLITGFRDRKHALSFEWYVKRYKWFPKGSWRREHLVSPITRRRRQIELLFEKFGTNRFQNLTLHDIKNPPCYDCLNKGRRTMVPGERLKKITPCSKPAKSTFKTRFQHASKTNSNNCCGRPPL